MPPLLHQPFKKSGKPDPGVCFYTGRSAILAGDRISFLTPEPQARLPEHLKNVVLLDGTALAWDQLTLPALPSIQERWNLIRDEFFTTLTKDAPTEGLAAEIYLSTLFYALLYHNLLRSEEEPDPILLTSYRNLFQSLQSSWEDWAGPGTRSHSLFALNLDREAQQISPEKDQPMYFRAELKTRCISFGLGTQRWVAHLGDGGILAQAFASLFEPWTQRPLHPLQFRELEAHVYYGAWLLGPEPKIKMQTGVDGLRMKRIPGPWNRNYLLSRWDARMFSKVLGNFWMPWKLKPSQIYKDPDGVVSFLEQGKGHMGAQEIQDLIREL